MSSARSAKTDHSKETQHPLRGEQVVRHTFKDATTQPDSMAALRDFGSALLNVTTLDGVLELAGQHLGTALPNDGGFILVRSQSTSSFHQHAFGQLNLPHIDDEQLHGTSGIVAQVLTNGQPRIAYGNNKTELAFWELQILTEAQSFLCVPLWIEQRCDGVVAIRGQAGIRYSDAETTLLMILAASLSLAIERAQQHAIMARLAQATKIDGMRRLTSTIGHELRNPLQGLQGSLQLLLNTTLASPKRALVLQKARDEVEQLSTTVQRMLECYSPAYEDMRPIAIPAFIERVLALAATQLQERQIIVDQKYEEGLPHIRGVEGHLKQAFLSLVLNALEAMPAGGRLAIRGRTYMRPSDGIQIVHIDVTDSGPGIATERHFAIFEPFYSTKTNQIGLGLAISYGIIEHHAGSLTVDSDDAGTTFSILLPAY